MQGGTAPPEGRAGAHGRRLLPLRHPAHGGTRDRLPEGRRLLPGGAAAALGPDPHPSCGQVTLPCPRFGRSGGAPLTGPAAPADKEKSEPITGRRRVRIFDLVRITGLEPARLGHWTLKPARLPVPPYPHIQFPSIFTRGGIARGEALCLIRVYKNRPSLFLSAQSFLAKRSGQQAVQRSINHFLVIWPCRK